MRAKYIDSARLFKVLAIADQRKLDKLIKKAKRKQKWYNFKRSLGL